MRLIDADNVKKRIEESVSNYYGEYSVDMLNMWGLFTKMIDETPTVEPTFKLKFDEEQLQEIVDKAKAEVLASVERPQGEWNIHQVACILAELFGDTCACNYCGIDEWLPKVCDFANKECPDVVGVACWEQFLKHRAKMEEVEE